MMRAWTKIVACGTALGIRKVLAAKGHALSPDDVEDVSRSAIDYAATLSGADYLEAVGKIHAYGREMARFFDDWDMLLTATLAEPPAKIGRFSHTGKDYVDYRMGAGMVFDYSPFCAAFNASGQPAASLPLFWNAEGLPIGIHLAARFGADEDACRAVGRVGIRPPLGDEARDGMAKTRQGGEDLITEKRVGRPGASIWRNRLTTNVPFADHSRRRTPDSAN